MCRVVHTCIICLILHNYILWCRSQKMFMKRYISVIKNTHSLNETVLETKNHNTISRYMYYIKGYPWCMVTKYLTWQTEKYRPIDKVVKKGNVPFVNLYFSPTCIFMKSVINRLFMCTKDPQQTTDINFIHVWIQTIYNIMGSIFYIVPSLHSILGH